MPRPRCAESARTTPHSKTWGPCLAFAPQDTPAQQWQQAHHCPLRAAVPAAAAVGRGWQLVMLCPAQAAAAAAPEVCSSRPPESAVSAQTWA